jgi:hypothetical protein
LLKCYVAKYVVRTSSFGYLTAVTTDRTKLKKPSGFFLGINFSAPSKEMK